jgi:hypothetical protein
MLDAFIIKLKKKTLNFYGKSTPVARKDERKKWSLFTSISIKRPTDQEYTYFQ